MSRFSKSPLTLPAILVVGLTACGPTASDRSHPDFEKLEKMTEFPRQFELSGFDSTSFNSASKFCLFWSYDRPDLKGLNARDERQLKRRLDGDGDEVAENESLFAFQYPDDTWTFVRFPSSDNNIKGGIQPRCHSRSDEETWADVEARR